MRPARANNRDLAERAIVRALRSLPGCVVSVIDTPADLLVGYRGNTYLLEVKTPTRQGGRGTSLTPHERQFHSTWTGHLEIVTSPDEALEAIGIGGEK